VDPQRLTRIRVLALPIVAGLVSQNVLNLVDAAIVGRFGAEALAAVGVANFANFLAAAAVMGLSAGVQAMAARRCGEGRPEVSAVPLNGGLMAVAAYALPMTALLFLLAPVLFPLLQSDPAVVDQGVPYLRARLLGMIALGSNFVFRGFWNGIEQPRIYMRTLVAMHIVNIVLSLLLAFGWLGLPRLGALGAGIGTTVSLYVGTAMYAAQAFALARGRGFLAGLPDLDTFRTMLRVSMPASIQQVFLAGSLTALFWIIGKIGTHELAAANVLLTLTLVALLPGMGLGMAAASLVGQALGRGDAADARRWGWEVAQVGLVVAGSIGLALCLAPRLVLRAFIDDADALELAVWPLVLMGATIGLDAGGAVLLGALQGAGDSRTPMRISVVMQGAVLLPGAWIAGPLLGGGLLAVWFVFVGQRFVQTLLFVRAWYVGRWASVRV
jgi:MATE family multidrug resistance protein